jgi:hypothetical protein
MRVLRTRRISPAMAVALVALVVALGGTAVAAHRVLAPANSVNSAAVINHSLQQQDFKRGLLKSGPVGRTGATGPAGPVGPSNAFVHYRTGPVAIALAPATTTVTSLAIPAAGTYVFWAKAYIEHPSTVVTCDLKAGGDLDESRISQGAGGIDDVAMNVAHVFSGPGTVDLVCSAETTGNEANFATVSGIQVANLTRADG